MTKEHIIPRHYITGLFDMSTGRDHFRFTILVCVVLILIVSGACHREPSGKKGNTSAKELAIADSLNHFDPESADSIYRKVLNENGDRNKGYFLKALIGLASVHVHTGNFDSAKILVKLAIQQARTENDTGIMLEGLLVLGNIMLEQGRFGQSESCFEEGLSLAKASRNKDYQNNFILDLGNVQIQQGSYPAAIRTFTEGVRIFEKAGHEENLATAFENLGMTLKYTGEYEEGIRYLYKSLQIRQKLNLLREYAGGLQNLGILYKNAGNNDSALAIYRRVFTIVEGLHDSVAMIRVRYNIAVILKNERKFKEAEAEMNHVLAFSIKKKLCEGQAYALSTLSDIYEQNGQAQKGLLAVDSAIRIARRFGLTANLANLYERKQQVLFKMGRFSDAYNSLVISKNISDSLLSIDKQKEIASLKTRFETERKEDENILLRKNVEVQRVRIWILWVSLSLGSLVFIILLTMFHFRHKQVKQEKELVEEKSVRVEQQNKNNEIELEKSQLENQLKEQELIYQTLVRADLTQLNRSVQEKLLPFTLRLSRKKDQEEFTQVLNEITRDAGKDPMAEFEIIFKQLHSSFYEKLLQQCNDISKTELQVCALLRLNLSTKDIARLINLSVATIEITRHHIRKKLKLEPGESLSTFLITL